MLLESVLHEKYIEYLKREKIQFEHEARIANGVIDFKVDFDNKTAGVEVKADRAKLFSTVGQMMSAKRTFSDVYLLSTEEFYNAISEILVEFGLQNSFGFIIFKNNSFVTLSKPRVKEYYFNSEYYKPRELKSKPKTLNTGPETITFLKKHLNEPFMCIDIVREFKMGMEGAYKVVSRWKRFGLIELLPNSGLPKFYRVLRIPNEEYEQLNETP